MNNTPPKEFYLGDGLYASFDGYQVRLRAPRLNEDHIVYLDAVTWKALCDWRRQNIPLSWTTFKGDF